MWRTPGPAEGTRVDTLAHSLVKVLWPVLVGGLFAHAGQSAVERALLAQLLERGFDVRIVASGNEGERARVARYAASIRGGAVEVLDGEAAGSPDVLEGVDALLLHSLPQPGQWAWFERVQPIQALPTVQYVHSLLLAGFERDDWGKLWSGWNGWPPARLVAPSRSAAQRARTLAAAADQRGGALPSVEVIPHGVDAAEIDGGERALARATLGLDANASVVLSVGRISAEKAAYPQLILAFRDVVQAQAGNRPVLIIAGGVANHDRRYVAGLRSLARRLGVGRSVSFVTSFDPEKKPLLYAAADVFAALADNPQESFGIALLEAMTAGLPVVATDWNGYREVLPAACAAQLVPTVASHALARTLDWTSASAACAPAVNVAATELARLIADRPLRDALGAEGQSVAREHSWQRAGDSLVQILETLVADQRAGTRSTPTPVSSSAESMVEGLASVYLDDDPRLVVAPSGRRQARVLRLVDYRLPQAYRNYGSELQLARWHPIPSRFRRRGRRARELRDVLQRAVAGGATGVHASELRSGVASDDAAADWLLLQLVRFGLLDVVGTAR
jgi:glycosyltransferase involved in cell wall biosynthesis